MDFLFAFILVMGFSGLLFAVTITLTTVEITQYITYASARNYMTSHLDIDDQQDTAENKFNQLVAHPVVAPLFAGGWFELGQHTVGINGEYQTNAIEQYLFRGTWVDLTAHMLDFNIPFFGSTASDETKDGGFRTTIGSYLGIEPSVNQCVDFTRKRWEWLSQMTPYNSSLVTYEPRKYRTITDNGC